MPKETDRLKLSLPLGNENVTRESINGIFEKIDAGVATHDEVEALRQMMSEMDIPEASLTVKGKVQLSNKTDGISQSLAATEKAVNDARLVSQEYVDGKTWQKYRLTQDNGRVVQLAASYDLNNLVNPGYYYANTPVNGPTADSCYVEVVYDSTDFLMHRTTSFHGTLPLVHVRIKSNNMWRPWTLQTPEENQWGAL